MTCSVCYCVGRSKGTTVQQTAIMCQVGLYVTVFWKTDHLDTGTEIHLLPVHDRHTHALSRNTKH